MIQDATPTRGDDERCSSGFRREKKRLPERGFANASSPPLDRDDD